MNRLRAEYVMHNSNKTENHTLFAFISLIYLYGRDFNILRVAEWLSPRRFSALITNHCSGCSYHTFNAHASTDTLTFSYAASSGLYWLTDRIAQTSSKSSWYKVTLRKWRGAACATCRWLCASESVRGNVSVNVNANSNMPVIIISSEHGRATAFPRLVVTPILICIRRTPMAARLAN